MGDNIPCEGELQEKIMEIIDDKFSINKIKGFYGLDGVPSLHARIGERTRKPVRNFRKYEYLVQAMIDFCNDKYNSETRTGDSFMVDDAFNAIAELAGISKKEAEPEPEPEPEPEGYSQTQIERLIQEGTTAELKKFLRFKGIKIHGSAKTKTRLIASVKKYRETSSGKPVHGASTTLLSVPTTGNTQSEGASVDRLSRLFKLLEIGEYVDIIPPSPITEMALKNSYREVPSVYPTTYPRTR